MSKIFKILSKEHSYRILSIIFLTLILSFLEFTFLGFVQPLINFFSYNQSLNEYVLFFKYKLLISDFIKLFIIVFLLRVLLSIVVIYLKHKTTKIIFDQISQKILDNYLNQNFVFFITNKTSQLVSNLLIEVSKFCFQYVENFIFMIIESLIILSIMFYLLINYPKITMIFILITFTFFLFFYLKYKKNFKLLGEERAKHDAIRVELLQNIFDTIQIVKIYNQGNILKKNFLESTRITTFAEFRLKFFSELPKNFIEVILIFLMILSFFLLNYFENINKIDILSLVGLYVIALFRLVPSCNRVFHALNTIKYLKPTLSIIKNELEILSPNSFNQNHQSITIQRSLEFKNISFKYSKEQKNILSNASIYLSKSSIIGITGQSGSGKSTFLNIVSGLLLPDSGEIFLDNNRINYQDVFNLQKKIGYVTQKSFLINETILYNIVLNDLDSYDKSRLDKAIKLSNLEDIISKSPSGLLTYIGNRGDGLSGGQQQRVCIARAIYRDPAILIFDEATNALDKNNVDFILNTLKILKENRIIIVVSHENYILQNCDKVFLIKDGKIKEK